MGYGYWSLCLLEQKDIHLHYVNHSFETIAFQKVGRSGLQPSVAGPTHVFFSWKQRAWIAFTIHTFSYMIESMFKTDSTHWLKKYELCNIHLDISICIFTHKYIEWNMHWPCFSWCVLYYFDELHNVPSIITWREIRADFAGSHIENIPKTCAIGRCSSWYLKFCWWCGEYVVSFSHDLERYMYVWWKWDLQEPVWRKRFKTQKHW